MNRTRILLLGLLFTLLPSLGGCFLQPADLGLFTPAITAQTQRKIVVRGDSLGAMAERPAKALFKESPTKSVAYWALGGTQIDHHMPALALVQSDMDVVMELGTNDTTNNLWSVMVVDLHAAAAALAPANCQVWFTLNETGGKLRGFPYWDRTRWFNEELLRMDADEVNYPNLIVFRWDLIADGHVDWLINPVPGGDYVHLTTPGTEAMAQSLVDSAALCPEVPLPPTTTTTTVPPESSTTTTSTEPDASTTTTTTGDVLAMASAG